MDDPDLVFARSRLYALLARGVLEGPTDALGADVAGLPALAAAWPEGDADARAAAHHRVLGMQVFPYESVFLGDGQLGGPVAAAVVEAYRASGLPGWPTDVEADHIGIALRNLAWLSAAEADALKDARPEAVARVRVATRAFLDEHLLRWLAPLVVAVEGTRSAWHATVVQMALELATGHREGLGGAAPAWDLPNPGDPLEDPETGLKRIAAWLLAPARAGWLVTAGVIDRWATASGVPRGFGRRLQTLESLLFGAADHQRFGVLVQTMRSDVEVVDARYEALGTAGAAVGPWRRRLAATRRLLDRLARPS